MGAARDALASMQPRLRNAGALGATIISALSRYWIRSRQRWKLAVLTTSRSQKAATVRPLPEKCESSARYCDSSRRTHFRPRRPAMAVTARVG